MSHNLPGGGFLLSPPASSIASSNANPVLPHPRTSPLRSGGSKESTFIRYVDQQLLHIQRRYAKRTTPSASNPLVDADREKADTWGDVRGYATMKEACKDFEELMGVVWVSGTPSLQVPYLINIALLVQSVVQGMPPSPRTLFRLLGKLDFAFASLLQGRDVESGERLPGFEGRGVSGTEKVRIRSLVERTRLDVLEAFKRGDFEDEPFEEEEEVLDTDTDMALEGELVLEGDHHEQRTEEDESFDMQIARVYDRTVVELGDSLAEPNIGIITESRG